MDWIWTFYHAIICNNSSELLYHEMLTCSCCVCCVLCDNQVLGMTNAAYLANDDKVYWVFLCTPADIAIFNIFHFASYAWRSFICT